MGSSNLVSLWNIDSCWFNQNCTRNHAITCTNISFSVIIASTNCLEPRVLCDGAVLGEAQFVKEAGLPSSLSTCHVSWWVCSRVVRNVWNGNFESKLRLCVGFTGRIGLIVNWDETAVYVLGFCVGFVAAQSFWACFLGYARVIEKKHLQKNLINYQCFMIHLRGEFS